MMKGVKFKKLNSVEYLKGLSGKSNLIIRNGPSKEVEKAIAELSFTRLTIKNGNWRNLNFLLDHENKIIELFVEENSCDWSVISELVSLKGLRIGGWFNTKLKFDKLVNLERLSSYHNKGYDDSLYSLPKLKLLKILGWKEETCEKLRGLRNLEGLFLVDGWKLKDCKGLEDLPHLRYVEMYAMRNLVNADALGRSRVKCLDFECCKKVKSFEFVRHMKELIGLSIIACGDIPSLDMVMGLEKLDQLQFGGSNVVDGDIRKLLAMNSLRLCLFNNKRHYNLKREVAEAFLGEKWGDLERLSRPECRRPNFYL